MTFKLSRRSLMSAAVSSFAARLYCLPADAQSARMPFPEWVAAFRSRARARGIADATYDRVMGNLKPDTSVFALDREQPEFREEVWQYLNRRVSDWRVVTGKERAKEYAPLLQRIERDYGVDRYAMLGIWGMESAFGDLVTNPKHMRPIFPALAALAWGEPRRRAYWEQELLNALVIVDRGWGNPDEMIGSWAGAMGHTQWMPEVWLNAGVDYNGDGRITPYGSPDDALAGTAQYLVKRGQYRRGEPWGYEVRLPPGMAARSGLQPIAKWQARGVRLASGKPFPGPHILARVWQPVPGGPAFLITRNFDAVKSYNPANTYTLAVLYLGDRIRGDGPFVQAFPGGERALTLDEMKEVQRRLTSLGFDTGGADGRAGKDTSTAAGNFQRKAGMTPDGYPGLEVLARLREGSLSLSAVK